MSKPQPPTRATFGLPPKPPGRPRRRAPNGTQRYLPVRLLLPPAVVTALDALAEDRDKSRSEIAREALDRYIRREAKREERTQDATP